MFIRKPYALRATLLFTSLIFGSVSAFAQRQPLQGLPNVNLGVPKIDLPSRIELPVPPKLPIEVNVRVPSVGGLTPPLNVNVGGAGPGVPPLPETPSQAIVAAPQVAEKRLELLPTCR